MCSTYLITVLCMVLFIPPTYSIRPTRVAPPDLIHNLIANAKEKSRNTVDKLFPENDNIHVLSTVDRSAPVPKESPDMVPEESPDGMKEDNSKKEMKKAWKKRLLKLMSKDTNAFDNDGRKKCNVTKTLTSDIGFAVTSDYVGPAKDMVYYDKTFGFLKYAMGFNGEQVMESKKVALKHFKVQFGIEFDIENAKFIDEHNVYYDEKSSMALVPFMEPYHTRVIMHSKIPIPCENIAGVTGGWMVTKQNGLKLHGNYGGPEGIEHYGTVVLMNFFTAFLHATRASTRVAFYAMAPMTDKGDGYVPVSGVVYNFDDDEMGWLDGVSISQQNEKEGTVSNMFRGIALFPGRFTPIPKYNDLDYGYTKSLDH